MADCAPIVLSDVEQPVEDIIVILRVQYDLISAVEDRSRFIADNATRSQEA